MRAHVSGFYSHAGGTGRTLACLNVGAALARAGNRVLCIDADWDSPGFYATEFAPSAEVMKEHPYGFCELAGELLYGPPADKLRLPASRAVEFVHRVDQSVWEPGKYCEGELRLMRFGDDRRKRDLASALSGEKDRDDAQPGQLRQLFDRLAEIWELDFILVDMKSGGATLVDEHRAGPSHPYKMLPSLDSLLAFTLPTLRSAQGTLALLRGWRPDCLQPSGLPTLLMYVLSRWPKSSSVSFEVTRCLRGIQEGYIDMHERYEFAPSAGAPQTKDRDKLAEGTYRVLSDTPEVVLGPDMLLNHPYLGRQYLLLALRLSELNVYTGTRHPSARHQDNVEHFHTILYPDNPRCSYVSTICRVAVCPPPAGAYWRE